MQNLPGNSKTLRAGLFYLFLIAVIYAPVIFGAKTLSPAMIQPNGVVDGRPYGYTGRIPINTFNVDMATPAYYEWPVNRTVGNMYRRGELPLWNPYEAAGTPLAADYSTRAFFPYQIIEDISPASLWDFFLLGRPLIAGLFSFLFLTLLGFSLPAALIGGVFYMFSGVFVWFINLEQMVNVAMALPILLYSSELLMQRRGMRHTGFLAAAFSLVLLGGQPEAALYVLFLAFSYILFRASTIYRKKFLIVLLKSVSAFVLGLMVASPLLLPFIDYINTGANLHPAGAGVGVQHVKNWKMVFSALTPTATEIPADPSIIPEVLSRLRESTGETTFYRGFATKGVWDWLGGFTGALPIFLTLNALLFCIYLKRRRGVFLFFLLFGVFVVLKNLGVKPFLWLGYLPLFDRVWSPRWSGPVWVFCLSMAGASGLDCLITLKAEHKKLPAALYRNLRLMPLVALLIILAAFIYGPLTASVTLALNRKALFSPATAPFIVPSILTGNAVAIVLFLAAFFTALYSVKRGRGFYAFLALAATESWWNVPRCYNYDWALLKIIPFLTGLVLTFLVLKEKYRYALFMTLVFLMTFLFIDLKSPFGMPDRFDPFKAAPYIKFLKEDNGDFRTTGGWGVLTPNYAGARSIKDLRYINALMLPRYLQFRRTKLQRPVKNEVTFGTSLWFTGMPERLTVDYGAQNGPRYRVILHGIEEDILERLPYYSFMGVKYMLMPSWLRPGKPFTDQLKLVYDKEIRIYENASALPRAFVTERFREIKPYGGDHAGGYGEVLLDKRFFEADKAGKDILKAAVIKEYGANRVVIDTDAERPALLVLTDVVARGWTAQVDGKESVIYYVEGLVRGVKITGGRHRVVFYYSPPGFKKGVALFIVAAGCVLLLTLKKRRPSGTGPKLT